jgi:hypothetical protein
MFSNPVRYNAGIIRCNGTPFLSNAAGTETSAQLLDRHGNPIGAGKVKRLDAIHRTDWQGRQLLYPTARTNRILYSGDLSEGAVWQLSTGGTLSVGSSSDSFAGEIPYWLLTKTNAVSSASAYQTIAGLVTTVGQILKATCAFRATATSSKTSLGLYGITTSWGISDGSPSSLKIVSGPGSAIQYIGRLWQITGLSTTQDTLVELTGQFNTAEQVRFFIYPDTNTSTTTGAANLATRVMVSIGSQAQGAYIKTTSAASTVTDYTLSGATVNFGQAALAGAVFDWDGVAER